MLVEREEWKGAPEMLFDPRMHLNQHERIGAHVEEVRVNGKVCDPQFICQRCDDDSLGFGPCSIASDGFLLGCTKLGKSVAVNFAVGGQRK